MEDIDAIGLLQEPARRKLYEYVAAQGREVGRNEAAEAVGLQRTLAAFHLDRLAAAGLLEVAYRRVGERSGPGAGRPAKLYRRAAAERAVSLPPRDYVRAARVLADAIEQSGAEQTLFKVAREQAARAARGAQSPGTLEALVRELAQRGYEPYADADGSVRLRNCPFHSLAQDYPVIACGMNLALLQGMLDGAPMGKRCEARIHPRPGECCVVISSKTNQS